MGFIPEVKCARCDRRYSGLRRKCPYCGSRKNRGGKRMAEPDNGMLRVVVGGVLLLAILVAVIVIIVNSLSGDGEGDTSPTPPVTSGVSDNSNGTSPTLNVTDPDNPDDTEPSDPVNTEPVTSTVQSITLNRPDFTLSTIGEQWNLGATVVPADTGLTITWVSSNPSIASVNQDGTVTAISKGTVTVAATVGDKTAECIVRVTAEGVVVTATPGDTSSSGVGLSTYDVTIKSSISESFTLGATGNTGTPTYSSSNTSVATVTEGGTVTAVSPGTATISVTVDGVTLQCVVRVKQE